jgi:DNA-binding CsgD family transcriptional regulator
LQQLCAPLLDGRAGLPEPQRVALETAFGLGAGAPPEPLFVGLGALSLLSAAGSERPLLAVVDDVQWLDRASAQTLGVVARRLEADAVALLLAGRDPDDPKELSGIDRLELRGLADDAARTLLAGVLPGRVDEEVLERLVAETEGNPLALVELPRGLTPHELAGGYRLLEKLALPGRIEESFRRRVEELPAETRTLLLAAAAEPAGNAGLLWRACELLDVGLGASEPAESAGLIRIGSQVRFFHPLVRSVAYATASVEERRRVHAALAEATDPEHDPDRQAWHRAAAAAGPDEDVAAQLERSAERARTRGGEGAAGAFLERSVELTLDPTLRSRRALIAAHAMRAAGATGSALELVTTAELGPLDALQRAQAGRLRAQVLVLRTNHEEGVPELIEAAAALAPLDAEAASETHVEALATVLRGGRGREIIGPALAALPLSESPSARELLLHGYGLLFSEGFPRGTDVLAEAVARSAAEAGPGETVTELAAVAAFTARILWDASASRSLSERALALARSSGALAPLEEALHAYGAACMDAGRIADATAALAEETALRHAAGLPPGFQDNGTLAVLRDDEQTATRHIADLRAQVPPDGIVTNTTLDFSLAVLYNGLGRFDEALAAARRSCEVVRNGFALAELVEAAARCGELDLARESLDDLAARTRPASKDWGLGVEARCRALVSEGDDAESLYLEAVERLERADAPLPLARAQLVYGEWLRRRRRRTDARRQLEQAYALCDELGARSFAQRAQHELAATGATVHSRRDATLDELTPQEARIASLASDGLSNAEIATQLYITASTVDYHLKKVFRKLGVHSRTQLHRTAGVSTM